MLMRKRLRQERSTRNITVKRWRVLERVYARTLRENLDPPLNCQKASEMQEGDQHSPPGPVGIQEGQVVPFRVSSQDLGIHSSCIIVMVAGSGDGSKHVLITTGIVAV